MPFFWTLKSSFQIDMEILAIPPKWIPQSLTLEFYEQALKLAPIPRYMLNSLFVSLITATLCTIFGSMAGYVLARYAFPGATIILAFFLFTQLIPSITRIFPVYFVLRDLKLLNTYSGLVIAYVSFSLPYAVLMLQGFFRASYPVELEEAALIDGCNWFTAFTRIILPISIPGIVAIATYSFLGAWNDFLWASLILNKGKMKTIQVGLRDYIGEMGLQQVNAFMAACVMTAIPAIILFRFAQRNIVTGLTAGAVKG
jgi:multiple sugar transport system permease protein